MPQSLSKVLVHLIFSSKHREALIPEIIRTRLHGYIVGIQEEFRRVLTRYRIAYDERYVWD